MLQYASSSDWEQCLEAWQTVQPENVIQAGKDYRLPLGQKTQERTVSTEASDTSRKRKLSDEIQHEKSVVTFRVSAKCSGSCANVYYISGRDLRVFKVT